LGISIIQIQANYLVSREATFEILTKVFREASVLDFNIWNAVAEGTTKRAEIQTKRSTLKSY